MLFANSLIDGFMGSNLMGKGLVLVQLLGSVVMVAVIIGKWKELQFLSVVTRRFLRDFMATHGVLDYYLNRRPSPGATGVINIYAQTCERLLNLLTPDVRSLVAARQTDGDGGAALTEREVKLVQSTSENVLSLPRVPRSSTCRPPSSRASVPITSPARPLTSLPTPSPASLARPSFPSMLPSTPHGLASLLRSWAS